MLLAREQNNQINAAKLSLCGVLKNFMPSGEIAALASSLRGEERGAIAETINRVAATITAMPKTYETEAVETADKVFHLHYFRGGVDAWIVERDIGDGTAEAGLGEQLQAFGKITLYGESIKDAEWGYISIAELIANGVELDLYFTPRTIGEI